MTTAIMPIIVLGKSYLAVKANRERACMGCVGRLNNSALCHDLPYCEGIIFIDAHGPALPPEGVKVADEATHAALDKAIGHSAEYMRGHAAGLAQKQAEWDKWMSGRGAQIATAMVRNTDPATSKQAARDVDRKAGRIADLVLIALRDNNLTGRQLAANTGVALNSITPRFAQLSRRGLIHAMSSIGRETVWALGNGVAAAPSVSPSLFESA